MGKHVLDPSAVTWVIMIWEAGVQQKLIRKEITWATTLDGVLEQHVTQVYLYFYTNPLTPLPS